ncbi:nucleoside/nucleotide kinase family protein [Streptomyces sp. NPDC055722]
MDALKLVDETIGLLPADGGRVLLGVTGAPAAGKSTLARFLVEQVELRMGAHCAAYVPMDGFHLSNVQLDRLGLRNRKGSEPSFDVWGYVALLKRLCRPEAHPVYAPGYDRTLHEPVAARHVVRPSVRLVVTEGNYLGAGANGWPQARELLDQLWFLDTSDELREERLYVRQVAGGRDEAAARAWVIDNDRPNGELVKTTRAACTRVLTVEDLPAGP